MKAVFWVPGTAVAKGRPKASVIAGHVHMRTPSKTREWEKQIALFVSEQMKEQKMSMIPRGVPVTLSMWFSRPIPSSMLGVSGGEKTTKTIEGIMDKTVVPTTKPDLDNYIKCKDALNGVLWADDSQVWRFKTMEKLFAIPDEQPGMKILVEWGNQDDRW